MATLALLLRRPPIVRAAAAAAPPGAPLLLPRPCRAALPLPGHPHAWRSTAPTAAAVAAAAITMANKLFLGAADVDVRAVAAFVQLPATEYAVVEDGDAYADRVRASPAPGARANPDPANLLACARGLAQPAPPAPGAGAGRRPGDRGPQDRVGVPRRDAQARRGGQHA